MHRVAAAVVALMWLLAISPAKAQSNAPIEAVIARQLDAFKRNDAATAFAIASPMIQGMFGDAVAFLRMVENGYPQIFRARSTRFVKLATVEGRLIQTVLIEGLDGSVITAAYEMVEIDGQWRINGVTLARGEAA